MNLKRNTKLSATICIVAILFVVILCVYASKYYSRKHSNNTFSKTYDIALITNTTDISDSYSLSHTKDAAKNVATLLEKSFKIYRCDTDTKDILVPDLSVLQKGDEPNKKNTLTEVYTQTIEKAIKNGAKVIICPDDTFSEVIYNIAPNNINTYFFLINGTPHNFDFSDTQINFNVIPISFRDEETGFIAGYASVYEGYKHLSFIGLSNDTVSSHYGYGFLQGADYAAKELKYTDINVTYQLTNKSNITSNVNRLVTLNVNLIAACNEMVVNEVLEQTKDTTIPVITCNTIVPSDVSNVLAESSENISVSIYECLMQFFENELTGGTKVTFDASNNGIYFDYEQSKYKHFTPEIYQSIYSKLTNNDINIISDSTVSTDELGLTNITVNYKSDSVE